jgi:hypothetical protein
MYDTFGKCRVFEMSLFGSRKSIKLFFFSMAFMAFLRPLLVIITKTSLENYIRPQERTLASL